MLPLRRLTATLLASTLGWAGLAAVAVAPAGATAVVSSAQADTGDREPHDPSTYYAGTEGLTGTALALKLNEIIDGNTFLPYTAGTTDVWDALKVLDRDPDDPARIIDVYSGDSLDAANQCGSSCALDGWNREHTWAQSRGSFDTDPGPGTDLFHMRPSRGNTNTSRGNLDFDETVNSGNAVPGCPVLCQRDGDSFEPREAIKGDVARGLFYMDVRFNGDADDQFGVDLRMWDQTGNSSSQLGKLSTLVTWSLADPPDDRERTRNDLIDSDYQGNRNPFIDHPEWVCSIWSTVPACPTVVNQLPTTSSMTTTTPEDTATTVSLVADDADDDPLTWQVIQPPVNGSAGIAGSTLSYTPAASFHGTETVGVRVSDGRGGTADTTVTITVSPVNDAPIASPQSASTAEDTSVQVTLVGSDVDGDTLTYSVTTPAQHGVVSLVGTTATYTPATGYAGTDSFGFTVTDPAGATSSATVSLSVSAAPNQAPVATPVTTSTPEDTAKVIPLAASDADGDTLTYAIATQPQHGTVSRTGNLATYTPATDYHGPDSFTFTATYGAATSSPATVSITVTPVDDPPVNQAPTFSVPPLSTRLGLPVTATLTTSDADGDPVAISAVTPGARGAVSYAGTTLTYSPRSAGPDSFSVTVSDGRGGTATTQVTVTVAKAAARLKIAGVGALTGGEPGTIRVKVARVAGLAATGKVRLEVGDRTLTVRLKKGVATFLVPRLPEGSRVKVKATYAGDDQYTAGSARKTLPLRS